MSFKTPVKTNDAPRNDLLLSQAIIFGGVVYCSGSVGLDPKTNELVSGGIGERTVSARILNSRLKQTNPPYKITNKVFRIRNYHMENRGLTSRLYVATYQAQAIRNLTAVLEAAGSNINNVVKVTIFITDMQNYAAVNKVYEKYWGDIKPVGPTIRLCARRTWS